MAFVENYYLTQPVKSFFLLKEKKITRIMKFLIAKYPAETKYVDEFCADILKIWKEPIAEAKFDNYLKLFSCCLFLTEKIKNLKKVNGITKTGRDKKVHSPDN